MQETIYLSVDHLDYLQTVSEGINPKMPMAFGWPEAIRTILEKFEESGIDLADASSEEEIAQLAAGRLKGRSRRRAPMPTARISASESNRRAGRPACRYSAPGKGRHRFGRPPRSDPG